jgi:hypothetical protein
MVCRAFTECGEKISAAERSDVALHDGKHPTADPLAGSVVDKSDPWIRRLARLGYIAKGTVYLLIGILAVQAAVSRAGNPEGSEGALVTLLRQPFGRIVLALLTLGLVGYVVWRVVQAFRDPGGKGRDAKGLAVRTGYLISAVLYGGLAAGAVRLLMNPGSAGGDGGGQDAQAAEWTAMVMAQPLGRWVIGAVGAAVILFGLYEIFRAVTTDFVERYDLLKLPYGARTNLIRSGRAGLAARGIIFGVIGWFLIQAAMRYSPAEARGLEGTLEALRDQPYGPYLLGLVAIGLFAYGVFQIIKGRYAVIAGR